MSEPSERYAVIAAGFGDRLTTVAHTWDLARATGADDRLDAGAVRGSMAALEPVDADVRRPGGFAAPTAAPDEADEQVRFLCFVGRPA